MIKDRLVSDRNLLNKFVADFVKVLDRLKIDYILVSGFVAISHGRSRGTEDIDIIIKKLSKDKFSELNNSLISAGFECLQGKNSLDLYTDYLTDFASIRYVYEGSFVPEMELKFAKDPLDDYQLEKRVKLPLTKLPFWFSNIETNIAFKEELLKSPKDIEDSRHLRIIYSDKLDQKEIDIVKKLIKKYRLNK
ncbi:MAG: hypothetical protein PHD05_06875 [Sphaerochaetaceae bacterium]|nr:hypothetical protein [Sphaerochaetaceae bacterium]